MASPVAPAYKSRLPIILESYQKSLQKIDALEKTLEDKVAEKRHRAVNLLDEIPSYRRSTLRLYITHKFQHETKHVPVKTEEPAPASGEEAASSKPDASTTNAPATAPTNAASAPAEPKVDVKEEAPKPSATPVSETPGNPTSSSTTTETEKAPSPAKEPTVEPAKLAEMEEIRNNKWNLVIEGKLLTGHLDHEAADIIEEEAKVRAEKDGRRHLTQSSMVVDTAEMTSRERAATRFMHDREGEEPVVPINFSHFFDRISVSFQTFQKDTDPEVVAAASRSSSPTGSGSGSGSGSPSKTTRKGRRSTITPKKTPQTPIKEKPKPTAVTYDSIGPITSLFWNRHRPNPTNPSAPLQNAMDTHAFHAIHTQPREPITKENTVVATIRLHRRDCEQKYRPSPTLCNAIFPSLMSKKPKPIPLHEMKAPPEDNDVYIPTVLSMDDAIDAIFQYVLKNDLQDKTDRRIFHNDSALETLFGCKDMDMVKVKELLLSKGLLVPAVVGTPGDSPIVLTYVLKKETAISAAPEKEADQSEMMEVDYDKHEKDKTANDKIATRSKSPVEPAPKRRRTTTPSPQPSFSDDEITPNLISCDFDIDVPHLYHSRCKDILRRIKIREYEYTSCRTKAMRTVELTKAAEDVVKERLENIVKGKALTVGHQPVLSALAKAATSGSEARISAHADARTALLVDRLEEHCERARACWDIVEMCRGGN